MSIIKKIKNPYSIFHKDNLWKSYAFIEGELAKAQAEVGIIPKKAAINILKNSTSLNTFNTITKLNIIKKIYKKDLKKLLIRNFR